MSASFVPTRFSPISALRVHEFRLLWVGLVLAQFGNWMQQFALGWLVVEIAVRDGAPLLVPFYLGLVGLARSVPALVFGFIGGVYADRMDRRRLMLITRSVSAAIAIALAALTFTGQVGVGLIMLCSALAAATFGFDAPGRLAILASILDGPALFSGMSIARATMQLSLLLGPVLGGLLILPLGSAGVLAVVGAMYLLSFAVLLLMAPRPVSDRARRMSLRASASEGFRYLRHDPVVRPLMTLFATFAILGQSFVQLLPAVAHDSLGVGALELSWLMGAAGAGAVLGALAAASLGGVRRIGRVLIVVLTAFGSLLMVFGLQRSLTSSLLLLVLLGCSNILFAGTSSNLVQINTPDELRGRVLGFFSSVSQAGAPFGALLLGTAATFVGVSSALALSGALLLAIALFAAVRVPAVAGLRLGAPR